MQSDPLRRGNARSGHKSGQKGDSMENTSNKPFAELRNRIYLYYGSMADFAAALGCCGQTLSGKLNRRTPWKAPDIFKACKLLAIEDSEIPRYFSA